VRLLAARCLAALGRWDDVADCLGDGGGSSDLDDDEDSDDEGEGGFLDLRPDENGVMPFDRATRAFAASASNSSSSSTSSSTSANSLLSDAWLLRARARAAAGDPRGACGAFERALRRDPRCVEAFDALVVGGLAPPARHAAIVERASRKLASQGDSWLVDLYSARCACAPGYSGVGGGGSSSDAEAALARLQAPAPPPPPPPPAVAEEIATTTTMNNETAPVAPTPFHSPEASSGNSSQQPRRVTRAMARSGGGGGSASGGAGSVSGGNGNGGATTAFFTPGRGSDFGNVDADAAAAAPSTVSSGRRGGGGFNNAAATTTPSPPPRPPPISTTGEEEGGFFFGHGLSSSTDVAAAAASLALARGDPRLACSLSAASLARDPGAVLALRARVAALAELGARAELFSLAHSLVADRPRSPEAWHAVGAYYLASRNPRSARRAFARALACCDGEHAGAWVGLGHACSLAGEGDAAVGKRSFFSFEVEREKERNSCDETFKKTHSLFFFSTPHHHNNEPTSQPRTGPPGGSPRAPRPRCWARASRPLAWAPRRSPRRCCGRRTRRRRGTRPRATSSPRWRSPAGASEEEEEKEA